MNQIAIFDQAESYGGSIARMLDVIEDTPSFNYMFFTYLKASELKNHQQLANLKIIRLYSFMNYQKKTSLIKNLKKIAIGKFSVAAINKGVAAIDFLNELSVSTQLNISLRRNHVKILISNSNIHAVPMRINRQSKYFHIVIFRSLDYLYRWNTRLQFIDRFIFISDPLKEIYFNQLNISFKKSQIIGDPIDAEGECIKQEALSDVEHPKRIGDRFQLLCVARICRQKGQLDACKAFYASGIFKTAELVFLGDTDPDPDSQNYLFEILEFIKKNDIADSVRLVGFHKNPLLWIKQTDVVLHCATQFEGLGSSVIEAMQLGKIVIASDAGGPASFIKDAKNGFLYQSTNITQLAESIRYVFSNYKSEKMFELSEYASISSKAIFSRKEISRKYIETYSIADRC